MFLGSLFFTVWIRAFVAWLFWSNSSFNILQAWTPQKHHIQAVDLGRRLGNFIQRCFLGSLRTKPFRKASEAFRDSGVEHTHFRRVISVPLDTQLSNKNTTQTLQRLRRVQHVFTSLLNYRKGSLPPESRESEGCRVGIRIRNPLGHAPICPLVNYGACGVHSPNSVLQVKLGLGPPVERLE